MHQTSLVRVSSCLFFSSMTPQFINFGVCGIVDRALSGAPKDALRVETKESRETKNKRRDSFFVSMIGTRAASSIRADFSAMGMDPNFFFEKSIKSASQTTRTLKIFSTVFSKLTNFSFQKRTSYFNAGFSGNKNIC